MSLTHSSTGMSVSKKELSVKRKNENDKIIAIAGNPNVGKSTLFNALTGMNQHTGNWPGKTVANAQGYCRTSENSYVLVDIPGTYSLSAHSPEEEIARNFICFGQPDAVVVVCDATCLERSLVLVLQTLEITDKVVVCVNLLDEAEKKGIKVDIDRLSDMLGVKVVGTVARKKKSLKALTDALDMMCTQTDNVYRIRYPDEIETAVKIIEESLSGEPRIPNKRWQALKLLENDISLIAETEKTACQMLSEADSVECAVKSAHEYLERAGIYKNRICGITAAAAVSASENICRECLTFTKKSYADFDRRIDRILTGKPYGYIVMLLLLCFVFWLTLYGANYVSEILSALFSKLEVLLVKFLDAAAAPVWLKGIITDGIFRVTSWVVSVMLPPMAIFFPLFTLLEDVGYLPRIAYNLDKSFKRCKSCGKQALTMCMGFGCNAAGVIGCRIIDSERERLLAVITNSLVPCNGRFPAIITVITMFFAVGTGILSQSLSALTLTLVIMLGIGMTFLTTKVLSQTVLKGVPSSYTLEMPPYRKPQVLSVIVRSVFDRTLFVLGRSVAVAVPAGAVIWIMANVTVADGTLLSACAEFLDPLGRIMGLDGIILMAFILGFPANETVIPIIVMAYMSGGTLTEFASLEQMRCLFEANGWTWVTAVNVIIFMLFHWPCSTTVLTIKKETGSIKWTLLSVLLPAVIGILLCILINTAANIV